MAQIVFFDHSQNIIPKNQNFSFKLCQEVHSKFAESWASGKYILDFRELEILVHPVGDPIRTVALPLCDAVEIERDGMQVKVSQRVYADGRPKKWPPMSG